MKPYRRPVLELAFQIALVFVFAALLFFAAHLLAPELPFIAKVRDGLESRLGITQSTATWLIFLSIAIALGLGIAKRGRRQFVRPGESGRIVRLAELGVQRGSTLSYLKGTSKYVQEFNRKKDPNPVELFNKLIAAGFSVNASDIHISPEKENARIVLRVDGILHEIGTFSRSQFPFLLNRVKVLASLVSHVHNTPQDGRISLDDTAYQLRVSTLPTNHGEKIVCRLAVHDESRYDLNRIGFSADQLILLKTLLNRDHGLIYLTGPTGSGKTTTLYSAMLYLRQVRGESTNLVTLEDPVEVDLTQVAQTQVDPATGLTFALGLRSILRQDPDVIMVGEIRDEETAQTAIRAGMTGHLLLTSVHADSSAGVFLRLKQLNVDQFQMASASIAVVNQRLAVKNCSACRMETELTGFQSQQLRLLKVTQDGPFFSGRGCAVCRGTGRQGRIPLLEVMPVTPRLRELLVQDTPTHRLMEVAENDGMITLAQAAVQHAKNGDLPVDEVIRVLSMK